MYCEEFYPWIWQIALLTQHSAQAGVYLDLLTSVTEVNSTGSLSGDTASAVTLLGAHMFMVHCNLVSSKGNAGRKAAVQHVSMGTLCKLMASMLSRRAYKSVKPNQAQSAEMKKTQEFCKAWAVLPKVRAPYLCTGLNLCHTNRSWTSMLICNTGVRE